MNQLPRELLRQILGLLSPMERLECSLTCRSWAEEVSKASLLDEIWLIICGIEMETVLPAVLKSQRQYRNLRIIGADLTMVSSDLWTKFGPHIHRLQFVECNLAADDLYSILQRCPELESLALTAGYSEGCASYEKLKPSESTHPDGVLESFPKVRSLRAEFAVSDEILGYLLGLMPSATGLSICLDIQNPRSYIPNLVPCILGANRMFTRLDITAADLFDEDMIDLMKLYSGSLQELRVNCLRLTPPAYAAVGDCSRLQHLYLEEAALLEDIHVEKIVRNAPDLVTFDVSHCERLSDTGLEHLQSLKKIVYLGLFSCSGFTSNSLSDLGRISTLQILDLQGTPFDPECIRSIASLTNLRTLILDSEMDPESFNLICDNLTKLERIHLGRCERLTDTEGVKFALFEHLKSLGFQGGVGFTDRTFEEGLRSPDMEGLRLDASSLTDKGLASIAANQSRLMALELFNCSRITDAGLATLLRSETRLESLVLKSCNSLTDECLRVLENLCPGLETIELYECPISSQAVKQFKGRRPFVCVEHTPQPRSSGALHRHD